MENSSQKLSEALNLIRLMHRHTLYQISPADDRPTHVPSHIYDKVELFLKKNQDKKVLLYESLCVSISRAVEFYCAVMNPNIRVTVIAIHENAVCDGYLFIDVVAETGNDLYLLGEHVAFIARNSFVMKEYVTKEWLATADKDPLPVSPLKPAL